MESQGKKPASQGPRAPSRKKFATALTHIYRWTLEGAWPGRTMRDDQGQRPASAAVAKLGVKSAMCMSSGVQLA